MNHLNTLFQRINPEAEAEADESSKHIIPDDVIKDIMIWLPARTLGRLRCLSKEWFCFLTDPEFTNNHAIRTQSKASTTNYKGDEFKLVNFFPKTKSLHTLNLERGFRNSNAANKISLPWKPDGRCSPIGSCNGLICLMQPYEWFYEVYFLINPMTGEFTKIKYLRDASDELKHSYIYRYGFGYDLLTQDYKIVRISFYGCPMFPFHVDIFSLKNKCWTSIEEDNMPPFPHYFPKQIAAHVNGVLHWRLGRLPGHYIFTFDLATSKCGVQYDMPGGSNYDSSAVSVFQGCLCVTRPTPGEHYGYTVWLMKEYGVEESWTKFIYINPESIFFRNHLLLPSHRPTPICYANKGKFRLLLLQDGNDQVCLYKIEDESIRICKIPANFLYNEMVVGYTESLISPKLL